jgi:hypothetical protein
VSVLRGSCLCGGVTFEVTEAPDHASYCHCTRCQKRTGSGASAQAGIAWDALHVLSGEELVKAYDPGDGGWLKLFCSACGAALFSHDPERTRGSVRMSAFDEDPGVRPERRQFVASAAAWEPLPDDGLPRFERSSRRH